MKPALVFDETMCDLPCGGDKVEKCGGKMIMSVYVQEIAITQTTTARTIVASTTAGNILSQGSISGTHHLDKSCCELKYSVQFKI